MVSNKLFDTLLEDEQLLFERFQGGSNAGMLCDKALKLTIIQKEVD
jgi:hypothetical protein